MKTIPVETETVNAETGETEKRETVRFHIVPPRAGLCAVCGHDHQPDQPHNAQSLYYQYAFRGEFGRWPTWADAVAHCDSAVQDLWEQHLRALNAWTAPDGAPIAQPYTVQDA